MQLTSLSLWSQQLKENFRQVNPQREKFYKKVLITLKILLEEECKEFVSMPGFWTVGQAIDHLREQIDLPDEFYELFIVDPSNKPLRALQFLKF